MIPLWKLKREIRRVHLQLGQARWYIFGSVLKWNYDRTKHQFIKLTEGALPVQSDVAIVLIYQPEGILTSLMKTLDHLQENGFATVVVSNSPLHENDLESLRQHSFLVMQRPNFGYDFGGYRDAILHLLDCGHQPDNLLVMNDSIWFPLTDESSLLNHIRHQKDDMYGIVLAERPDEPERTHLQSYMFNFKKGLVEQKVFAQFWKKIPISSNKQVVIRRCEMRMTHAFKTKGFSIGYLHNFDDVKSALKSLGNDELNRIIAYQMQVDTSNTRTLKRLLDRNEEDPTWRNSVETLIDRNALGKYVLVAHPLVLSGKLDLQMLKKDKQPMYQLQRSELFACGFGNRICPEIRMEMANWDPR